LCLVWNFWKDSVMLRVPGTETDLNQTIFIKVASTIISLRDFYMEYFYIMYHKTDPTEDEIEFGFYVA